MADTFIQLPADSTGKKVRAFSATVGPDTVYSQASTLVDSGGNVMNPFQSGRLDVYLGASGITLAVSSTQLPAALVSGRLDVNIGAASATVTVTGTVTANEAKAEDAVANSGDSGIPILGVRNDAAASKTDANGDYSMLATDAAGRVGIADLGGSISVDDNGGSLTVDNGGTFAVQDSQKVADNAGFTDGATLLQPVGFVYDDVAGTPLTENDIAAARIDSKRAKVGVIEDGTTRGRYATVESTGQLHVYQSRGSSSTRISTATTTVVKSGAGILRRVIVAIPVGGGSTITIYDNTAASGTVIATLSSDPNKISFNNQVTFEARFSTGLTIVTSSAADVTVVYD